MNAIGIDKYEIDAWIGRLGAMPVDRVAHEDRGESYTMNRAHVFRLENGKYALVAESGCSCYSADDACIDLHPTEAAALASFEKWQKEN